MKNTLYAFIALIMGVGFQGSACVAEKHEVDTQENPLQMTTFFRPVEKSLEGDVQDLGKVIKSLSQCVVEIIKSPERISESYDTVLKRIDEKKWGAREWEFPIEILHSLLRNKGATFSEYFFTSSPQEAIDFRNEIRALGGEVVVTKFLLLEMKGAYHNAITVMKSTVE